MKSLLLKSLFDIKRRIQLERIVKGIAWLLGFAFLATVVATFFLSESNFSEVSIWAARFLILAGLILVIGRWLLYPLVKSPSPRRVARFLEGRNPGLQDRLSTAVEIDAPESDVHPELRELIQRDAVRKLREFRQPRFYWPRASVSSLLVVSVLLLVSVSLFLGGPEAYRYGLKQLLGNWMDQNVVPLYQVLVSPGDTTVAERSDLEVRATVVGFEPREVKLFARYEGQPQTESTDMVPSLDTNDYTFQLFDIRESLVYFVEADGIRSDNFAVMVADIPRVEKLTIRLRFPSYTGLGEQSYDETGDIRALKGTEAHLTIEADQPVGGGKVRFEDGTELVLESETQQILAGTIKVEMDTSYRILLENTEGFLNPASDEYFIEVIEDQEPVISFTHPGRDRKVTSIEEVFTELKVEDDYGLKRVALHYSVNGGPEESLRLAFPRNGQQGTASHTFYLEDMGLEPGDFISYFGRASDAVTSASTDIFFFEVEPFDREYYQSQANGGAGGQRGLELSKQQKQIVVATFALIQESANLTAEELKKNSQTVGLIQQRLQTQAQAIIDRIGRRSAASGDPRIKKMVEYLSAGIEHMAPAEENLTAVKPREALPEEQQALQKLLRAEALFNEMQVSMSQDGGGGASPEDLADLVDLELDRTKNQYETLQQNRAAQQNQQVDEAIEKLKELARRQQQQVDRQRKALPGSGKGQGDLAEEVERLARELARLSRQKQDQRLSRLSRELQRAARDMKKAQASGQSSEQANLAAQQALERLKRAQDALQQQRQSEVQAALEQLKQDVQQVVRKQREVERDMAELQQLSQNKSDPMSPEFYEKMRELFWQKQNLRQELQSLEGKLHQSSRRMQESEREVARQLKDAALGIRDKRIPDKMQEGSDLMASGLLELARRREQGVGEDLRELAKQVEAARNAVGRGSRQTREERLQQALGEAESLVEKLESLKNRLSEENSGNKQAAGQEGRQSQRQGDQQARSGQPGEGSPGEQPGESSGQQAQGSQQQGSGGEGASPRIARNAGGIGSAGIDPRQVSREWQERLREATGLREGLKEDSDFRRQVDGLLRQMRRLDSKRLYDDVEELARLKAHVIDGFHQLELELNRALQADAGDRLRLVDDEEVPPEFRERVEEYYRRLSARGKE